MKLAEIKHIAIVTENHERMARFYQTIFGMRKITTGQTDETGYYNPNRGHLSDGVIGLAINQRQVGLHAGLDHFGFVVTDVQTVEDRIKQYFPEVKVARRPGHVPFAGLRTHDPVGCQIDLSHKGMANVRDQYAQEGWGWDQPRQVSHIAIRASKPSLLGQFYQKVYGLKVVEHLTDEDNVCLSDDKVNLAIRHWDMVTYRGLMEGLDHFGFRVENLESARKDLDEIAKSFPASAPRKLSVGQEGPSRQKNLEACKMCSYALADPDGVLIGLSD